MVAMASATTCELVSGQLGDVLRWCLEWGTMAELANLVKLISPCLVLNHFLDYSQYAAERRKTVKINISPRNGKSINMHCT